MNNELKSELKDAHILVLLRYLLPAASCQKVIDWVKDKGLHVAGLDTLAPDKIRDMGSDEREALGNIIYDAYCHARGITRQYAPENLRRALDIVAYKFHFADAAAMRERSERLYEDVTSRLEAFAWRDNYLTRQALDDKDLAFAINTWFKGWRENWTATQEEFFEHCQTEHVKKTWRVYEPEQLFEAVQDFMQVHAGHEFNYNQVADGLQIASTPEPGALGQRMKVKDVLERLSNPRQNIYEDVYKYATRPNVKGKKSATVYVWAPLRRQLERTPKRRRLIISGVIIDYIRANSDCSQSQIKESVRAALGQCDNAAVISLLAELVKSKLISEPQRGPHNTYMYTVNEDSNLAEVAEQLEAGQQKNVPQFDPNDIFGVDTDIETVSKPNVPVDKWKLDEDAIMRIAAKRRINRSAV